MEKPQRKIPANVMQDINKQEGKRPTGIKWSGKKVNPVERYGLAFPIDLEGSPELYLNKGGVS